MNFQYKIRDPAGQVISGSEEADSKDSLVKELHERGYQPIVVIPVPGAATKPVRQPIAVPPVRKKTGGLKFPAFFKNLNKITIGRAIAEKEVLIFTRDLLSIVHAGVPIVDGLKDVAGQVKNIHFKRILEEVADDVNSGSKLSEAFQRHPKAFSDFFCQSIRAGEDAGRLEQVLDRLCSTLDRDLETSMEIKNAVRYPTIVLCFLGVAFTIMITFVIPRIAKVYGHFGADLPLPTRILIAVGDFFHYHGILSIVLIIGTVIAVNLYRKTKSGRLVWDSIMLRLPVFGKLFRMVNISRFASTLQTLYVSGIVLPEAVKVSSTVVDNQIIANALRDISEEVQGGRALSELMQQNKLFPALVVRMVLMGEKTGNLDGMLTEVIHHYDRDINYVIKNMTTLIEPMLIFFLGIMILIFALGVFLPMWSMVQLIRH